MKTKDLQEFPFVFYPSFRSQLKAIKSEKVRFLIYEALSDYGVCGIEPDFSEVDPLGTIDALFLPMRQEIDKAKARYIARVDNGKKGGNPNFKKGQPNPYYITKDNQDIIKDNLTLPPHNLDIDIDKDIDIYKEKTLLTESKKKVPLSFCATSDEISEENEIRKKRKRFVPPTLEEVREYINSSGYDVDPEKFFNRFEANGWKIGRLKMVDWKATVKMKHCDGDMKPNSEKEKSSAKKERATPQQPRPAKLNYDEDFYGNSSGADKPKPERNYDEGF